MPENTNEILAELESCLVAELRPHFLVIVKEDDFYNVIITHPSFVLMDMGERVGKVFSAIEKRSPKLIKNNIIIVQAFCAEELEDLFEYWVSNEQSYDG